MDREATPSPLFVEQRIRNRIMEYLELASSFEAQREYQAATAVAYVPDEVINQWDDWNPVDQTRWPGRLKAPYSDEEIAAMQGFHAEWEWVVEHTPEPLPELSKLHRLPEWPRLRAAAGAALAPSLERGRLPEDREV